MRKIHLAFGICALVLAACSERQSAQPPGPAASGEAPQVTAYQCGALAVKFDHANRSLRAGDETIALTEAVSASGAKYVGPGDTVFWSKGDRATLSLKGVDYPECIEKGAQADASGGEIFRARGNEPGWLLELGSTTYKFTGDYGDVIVGGATPEPERLSDGLFYEIAENAMSVRVTDVLCNDDSTGAPFPARVTVTLGDKTYRGCGGETLTLLLGDWRVTHVADAAVAPGSQTSIGFDDQGLVYGNSSCNRYSGKYALTPERLALGPLAVTEMACADTALMAQERRFLDQLQAADRFDIGADGSLLLYAGDREALRAYR